ncbi:class I SAM-dependent methyltransferase [Streptomyces inhibens]|uniref:Class I SAM-dependent methyltransferase n=1 Tax=Streptomyces inhibens TaxID=2293571 RepID=A0A371PV33_STRIH|nr:class I SAM-dependent methyltransferase [Streptomyces inhibens]REK86312.1 class I SAM-dependent methyltransferase [Streptomyces inhibens]
MPPHTPAEYWDTYKPHRGEGEQPAPVIDGFEWTQYPGHGPGAEILGRPARALDLGPAEGKEAVFLARQGCEVTGVDLSAAQVARATNWWRSEPRLRFVHADACDFLTADTQPFDTIYSVWGAVWFSDPEQLLPLVAKRLTPGGTFAFSQAEPTPGAYGPQPMHGKWLEGRAHELTVLRWQYTPQTWTNLLKRHGFTDIDARVLSAPETGMLGTLMVQARTSA